MDNLYEKDFESIHHIENALRARTLYLKDKDYVKLMKEVDVKTGEPVESIYEHPQQLSPEQLKNWLGALYFEQYQFLDQ